MFTSIISSVCHASKIRGSPLLRRVIHLSTSCFRLPSVSLERGLAWRKKKNCCPPFGQIIASRREHTQLLPRNTAPVSEDGITSRCISVSFGKGRCGYGTEQVGWGTGEENIKPERFNRSICSLAHGGNINPKHPRPGGLSGSGLARSFHTQNQAAQARSQQWFGFYLNQQQVLMKSFFFP